MEVKRRPDREKVAEYRAKLARLPEFFPELAAQVICPAFAGGYLEPSPVTFLSREKLCGIAMGDGTMEVVNLGQF